MTMVASLGVEPRWASPVDFESTASTSSATRPSDAPACASHCRPSLGAGTIPAIVYEILSSVRSPGARCAFRPATICRARCAPPAAPIHYENPRVVVGCVPEWQGRILLCQRAIEPRRGYWTTPAGFLENGETLQARGRARVAGGGAQPQVEVGSLLSITHVLHAAQVHVNFRAGCSTANSASARRACRSGCTRRPIFPGTQIAFPSIEFALRCYFEDRRAGARSTAFQRHQPAAAA